MVKSTDPTAAEDEEETPCAPRRVVVKKMANQLVKPKVTFVSLVGHAANGLAFSLMKHDEEGTATQIQDSTDTTMPKAANTPATPSFGTNGTALHKLEFSRAVFKTEQAVIDYLTTSNISHSRIVTSDDLFTVPGVHEASLDGVEMVKGDKEGVTYWIGKLKAPASVTPPSPAAPTSTTKLPVDNVSKSEGGARLRGDDDENEHEHVFKTEMAPELAEVVTKMDSYIARQTNTTTLDGTMNTGEPSIPGLWEVLRGVEVTVQNIVKSAEPADFTAKINAVFARGGQIVSGLAGLFVTVKKSDTAEVPTVAREVITKHFSSPAATAAKAPENEGVVKKSEATPAKQDASDISEIITKSLAQAVAPLVEKLGSVEATMQDLKKSDDVANARLAELEMPRQSRQSRPDDGEPAKVAKSEAEKEQEVRKAEKEKREAAEAEKDKAFAERQLKARFGI